jgi:predicted ATP-dependent endonuclease of OLD family
MIIKTISSENFRGIESLYKLNCGQINSYVGKNDSGKSSILKALDAFFNKNFSNKDIFQGKSEEGEVSITIQFEPHCEVNSLALDCDGYIALKKVFSINDRGRVTVKEQYICNDFDHEISNCWGVKEADLNKYLESLSVEYSKSGRGHTNLSKIEQIEENLAGVGRIEKCHPVGEMVNNLNKYYDEFEYPTFSIFDAEVDLSEGSTEFQNQFKPIVLTSIANNQELTDQLETNVKSDLESEFAVITSLLQKNIPEIEKINTDVVCNWRTLVKFGLSLKFKNDEFDIPLSHKGTGFKRLLMVAYFEYLAQKSDNKFQYFGIEEPETYLHPQLQDDLLDSFKILSQNSQFFITTHSPIFAGATDESNICVVTKENFRSLYHIPNSRDEMMDKVIQELGIRPNHNLINENIRKVVFLEGSGDCKFWEIVLTKLHGSVPDDILLIPCGGSQVDYYVNSNLCKRLNRKFIVILDKDIGAIDYESKQENANQLKTRVEADGGEFDLLRKREIENYYH